MINEDLVPGFDDLSEEPWQFRLFPWPGRPDGLIIHTFGPLHAYNQDVLFRKTEMILHRGYRKIVFNLAGSIWPDAGFYGRFLVVKGMIRSRGGDMALIGVHRQVELAFDSQQENKVPLNIRRTLEEADDYFRHRDGRYHEPVFPVSVPCPFCGRQFKATRPGRYRCAPDNCGWSLWIAEEGAIQPHHDHLVPGFDDQPLGGLQVTAAPLTAVEGGLLIRHAGVLESQDEAAYRDRFLKAQAAGFFRLILDVSRLGTTRYSFVHRALFTGKVPGVRHFVLVGVPYQWEPFWQEDGWPAPPCPREDSVEEALERWAPVTAGQPG